MVTAAAVSVTAGPAAAAPRVPVLRGHTTVTADSTTFTTVRLPRDVEGFEEIETTLHGRGRVRGLVLTEVAENFSDAATYVTVAPGYCTTPGCGDEENEYGGWSFLLYRGGVLPAGTYRLFVIADGAPQRVELRIEGLRGRTSITPKNPALVDLDSFRHHPISTPDGPVWMGGGFSELGGPSRGFALLEMWGYSDVPAPRPYTWGTCVYWEREHPAPDRAFAPTCPGSEQPQTHFVDAARGYVAALTAFGDLPYGMGGYSVVPLTSRHGGVGLWMPLTEALPEPAP